MSDLDKVVRICLANRKRQDRSRLEDTLVVDSVDVGESPLDPPTAEPMLAPINASLQERSLAQWTA